MTITGDQHQHGNMAGRGRSQGAVLWLPQYLSNLSSSTQTANNTPHLLASSQLLLLLLLLLLVVVEERGERREERGERREEPVSVWLLLSAARPGGGSGRGRRVALG